ncbi:MAG: 3-oxoacyl-[acyl-carrier-protein] reductase [Lachnospirales bacterium]
MDKKTVVVTGGAKGIGRKILEKFAKEGYNVVVNYRSNIDEDFVKSLEAITNVLVVKGDVTVLDDCKILIDSAIEKFGKIDVLVNNAGITNDTLILRMSEEQFSSVVDTNLKSTFLTTQYLSNIYAKQRSGCFINISSVVGVIGNAGQSNYAASKAGIIGFTKSIARELGKRGVRANAIAPGFIETDMTAVLSDKIKDTMLQNIPLGRFGTGEEVADAAYYLAEATYVTGQVLNVCGGMVM